MTSLLIASLDLLIGRWHVSMTTTSESGDHSRGDGLLAIKSWFAGQRYVREEIEGDFAGMRHQKLTLLGYNSTRDRFEHMTAGNHDGVILLYATSPGGSRNGRDIELFADYAMPNESGDKATFVTVRTTIKIETANRHVLRNAYRYAAGIERPFLEYVYTR